MVPRIAGSTTRLETADRTTFGTVLGTASYMSPEQASGEELDGLPRGWRRVIFGAQQAIVDELGLDASIANRIFSGNFERVFG